MPEGYISEVECAGGCGILMTQASVNAGRKYIYGHKGGCPVEGAPARTRYPKTPRERVAPAPVEHHSYEKTLLMTHENLKLATARCAELEALRVSLFAQIEKQTHDLDAAKVTRRHYENLVDALEAVTPPPTKESASVEHPAGA